MEIVIKVNDTENRMSREMFVNGEFMSGWHGPKNDESIIKANEEPIGKLITWIQNNEDWMHIINNYK